MKTINTIIGTVLLVAISFGAHSQEAQLENYLSNDCDDPMIEKSLIENAEIWQEDLIKVAFNGPASATLNTQREYLKKRFAILKDAAENADYSWLTDEYRREILSITEEEFLTRELNSLVTKYKEQALRGLEVLRSSGVLEESNEMNVELFPNPAVEYITVEVNFINESDYLLSIIDFNGATVLAPVSGKGKTLNRQISVERLPAGEYFAQIVSADGLIVTKKFVIVK